VSSLPFDDALETPGVTVAVRLGSESSVKATAPEPVDEAVNVEVPEPAEHSPESYRIYTKVPSIASQLQDLSLTPLDVNGLDDPLDAILTYCLDTVLSDEAKRHENWQQRVHAMATLTRLALGGAGTIPFFLQEMNASQHILETQLNDRRSAVSKQACLLVSVLMEHSGIGVKNVALALQPSLLKLHGVSIAVISQSAHECLQYVYEYCHDRRLLSHLCSVICTDRNVKLRYGAVWQLLRVLECWHESLIDQYRVDVEQTMMAAVVDASEGVRRVGRQMFEVYCVRFGSCSAGGMRGGHSDRLLNEIERGLWSKVDNGTKKSLIEMHKRIGESRQVDQVRAQQIRMTPRRVFGGNMSTKRTEENERAISDGPKRVLSVMKAGKAGRVEAGGVGPEGVYASRNPSASNMGITAGTTEDRQSIRRTGASIGTGAMRVAQVGNVAAGSTSAGAARRQSQIKSASRVSTAPSSAAARNGVSIASLIRDLYTPGRIWSDKVDCLRHLETAFMNNPIKEHMSNESFDMLSDALVAEIGDSHYRVACQAMSTLSAAFGCPTIAQHLQHHMEQLVPVLFVRIGDTKECIRTAASEALLVLKEKNDLELLLQGMVSATRSCKATKAQCAIMMYFEDVFDIHRGSSGNAWRTMLAFCLRMATNKNPDVREHAIAACARVYHSGKMAAVEAALSGLPTSPRATIKTALDKYAWDASVEQSKSQSRLLSDALHYSEDETDAILDEDDVDVVSKEYSGYVFATDGKIERKERSCSPKHTNSLSNSEDDGSVSFGDVCVESPDHAEYEEALDDLEVAKRSANTITLQPLSGTATDMDTISSPTSCEEVLMMLSAPPNELFVRLTRVGAHETAGISPNERSAIGTAVWDAFCTVILTSHRTFSDERDATHVIAVCSGVLSFFGFIPKEKMEEKLDSVLCALLDMADGDDYELSTVTVAAGIQLVKAADPADAYSCLTPLLPNPSEMPPFRGSEARRLVNVLKFLRPCLRQAPRAQLNVALDKSLPSLCRCFESPHAEIRHLCLDCIVMVMLVVGEDAVATFTKNMSRTQQQIVALHHAKSARSP
jgi:hypothetical protein